MDFSLKSETDTLIKSWEDDDPEHLSEYLILGFQNPLINMQSILTRHLIIKEIFNDKFEDLMQEEIQFSIKINKIYNKELLNLLNKDKGSAHYHNKLEIRKHLNRLISSEIMDEIKNKWIKVLKNIKTKKLKILEVACGSANDYQFIYKFGLAEHIDYTGIDITKNNIINSKKMFPNIKFKIGNVFDIAARNNEYDFLMVFDLFEHFSYKAIVKSIHEVCRVTSGKLILNFFNMADIQKNEIKPKKNYHWNLLSSFEMKKLISKYCSSINIINISDYLKNNHNYEGYYNNFAFTAVCKIGDDLNA